MPTDDLNNIEAKLNFSKRLGGLIKGHQQEMQQVLDENEDLQMLVEQLLKENATLKSHLAEEKTKNTHRNNISSKYSKTTTEINKKTLPLCRTWNSIPNYI